MIKSKTYSRVQNAYFPLKRLLCIVFVCSSFALNGCGYQKILPSFAKEEKTEIQKKREKMKEEISYLDEKRPKNRSNPKNMFGGSIRSDSDRMDRLERAVQDMRNEFNHMKPSITRLTALESEIQKLIHELKQINEEDTYVAPRPTARQAPKAKYTPPKTMRQSSYQKKMPPPVNNGKASVYDVRIGEHPGRTRIVMDVNSKTGFSVDIDNDENIMIVELPQAGWTAAKSKRLGRSSFISSYKVETSGNGHILILQLKRNAKVTYKDDLKGNTGNARRFVIDLSGA